MRRQVLWLAPILMAVFGFAVVPTKAQTVYGVRADVPFDFIVGSKTLPAGEIIARRLSSAEAGPMEISNLDVGQVAMRIGRRMTGSEASNRGKLVFHRYGDRHYLAEIWVPGYKAIEVIKSKGERAIERELRLTKSDRRMVVTVFANID